jgi:phosphatidylserine synthase 2
MAAQFSPHDFTAFKWEGTASFFHYVTVVLLLAVFLAAELTPFYLKVNRYDSPPYPSLFGRD